MEPYEASHIDFVGWGKIRGWQRRDLFAAAKALFNPSRHNKGIPAIIPNLEANQLHPFPQNKWTSNSHPTAHERLF